QLLLLLVDPDDELIQVDVAAFEGQGLADADGQERPAQHQDPPPGPNNVGQAIQLGHGQHRPFRAPLDAGAGDAARVAPDAPGPDGYVTGIDLSDPMLALGARRAATEDVA